MTEDIVLRPRIVFVTRFETASQPLASCLGTIRHRDALPSISGGNSSS